MRRTMVVTFLLLASVLVASSVGARPAIPGLPGFKVLDGITVPPEWNGIWTVEDSTYNDCNVNSATYSSDEDTLCGGEAYEQENPTCPVTCTGTATATTIDATCTSSCTVGDCTMDFNIHTVGTMTASSYRIVTTVNLIYSGTSEICSLIPPSCIRIVSYGTRTGPAPPAYCLTSAKPSSWGRLKLLYR